MTALHHLSTRDLTTYLLELHQRSHELGYRAMQRFSLERLASLIPFDAGLIALGTIRDGVPHGHDVLLHNRPPELMTSWDRVKHEDAVALFALANPGITGNFAVDGPIFEGREAARAHCAEWKLAHVLCTSTIDAIAGLYGVVSVYREDPARPFSEAERSAMELAVPHLFAATRQARLGQLRAFGRVEGHGQSAAAVNEAGLVLEAEPGWIDLVRSEWRAWSGPWLPAGLWTDLERDRASDVVRGRLVLRLDPAGDVLLLHARTKLPADELSPREREIARAFSLGETYREIGARLGIAPNTVRRHLANIYEKLGISSKVELDRMIGHLG